MVIKTKKSIDNPKWAKEREKLDKKLEEFLKG